jgi:dihydrofolate synthase/folylpolyglutamate synthase
MTSINNPQSGLPVIQVAGTNGKGSVSAITSNILIKAGYKTGLFTSPHLVHVNERIRINGVSIPDKEIDEFITNYKTEIEINESTFFETITALAFWYFKKKDVDIAIMETGLGGRLDSVSICEPLATIITPISYDHMEILGESLAEIAFEKAGVIKKNVVCISAKQNNSAAKVLSEKAEIVKAPIHFINGESLPDYHINIQGETQRENALLAVSALNRINGFNITCESIIKGLQTVQWFGRNQILQENPIVVFDVAHNIESLRRFLDYFETLKIHGESVLIIALQARKRIQPLIPRLLSIFKKIICTKANGHNPMDVETLINYFTESPNAEIIQNPEIAIQSGLNRVSVKGGIAIVGTHCLGPAVSKIFKLSFDRF